MSDRVPPHNLEAERAILGGCLVRPEGYLEVSTLPPEAFYRSAHQTIWAALAAMDAATEPLDIVLLLGRLTAQGDLERVGGAAYVSSLVDGVSRSTNVGHYAAIVRAHWQRRKVIAEALAVVTAAHDHHDQAPSRLAAEAVSRLESAVDETARTTVSAADLVASAPEVRSGVEIDATPRAPLVVPWPSLARYVRYWRPGDMIVIGGRPSDGKTSLALQVAMSAAQTVRDAGVPGDVLFCSAEMSPEDIWSRAVAIEGQIPSTRVMERYFCREDGLALTEALHRLRDLPLVVEDASGWRMAELSRAARLRARQRGLALVVIDYLQLLEADRRRENRQAEVSDMSRAVKGLAKALRVPVIALAQLNRPDKGARGPAVQQRPKLSDLRESGAIEQDADVVLLLHRPVGARAHHGDVREVIVAKQRNGPIGLAKLAFRAQFAAFGALETHHDEDA